MSGRINRELFGGAITAETIPDLIDASDIRQVPDTQEVFLYPNSGISIVVEILERVDPPSYEGAIRFHFDSLAHDNSAGFTQIDSVSVIPNDRGDPTPSAVILYGTQHISKFNRSTLDEVHIFMGLFRVEEKRADLVVTFNVPVKSAEAGAVDELELKAAQEQFGDFVRSLRIVNYELFA